MCIGGGGYFCDFLFAFLLIVFFKRVYQKENKQCSPREQFLSFRVDPVLRKGQKTFDNAISLKVYEILLSSYYSTYLSSRVGSVWLSLKGKNLLPRGANSFPLE